LGTDTSEAGKLVGNENVTMTGVGVGVCANPVQKSPLHNALGSLLGTGGFDMPVDLKRQRDDLLRNYHFSRRPALAYAPEERVAERERLGTTVREKWLSALRHILPETAQWK
jgi:hypothetical protein